MLGITQQQQFEREGSSKFALADNLKPSDG
jgi:hypothetical protein